MSNHYLLESIEAFFIESFLLLSKLILVLGTYTLSNIQLLLIENPWFNFLAETR